MRTKKITDPVVTVSVLDRKFDEKLKKFVTRDEFDKAIKALHGRCDGLGIQIFDLRQDMMRGFERMDGKFDQIMGHIDAFMKRTEANSFTRLLRYARNDI